MKLFKSKPDKQSDIEIAIEQFNEFKQFNYSSIRLPSSWSIEVAISALQAQAERRWIPVSEGCLKTNSGYIVANVRNASYGNGCVAPFGGKHTDFGRYSITKSPLDAITRPPKEMQWTKLLLCPFCGESKYISVNNYINNLPLFSCLCPSCGCFHQAMKSQ